MNMDNVGLNASLGGSGKRREAELADGPSEFARAIGKLAFAAATRTCLSHLEEDETVYG
jgi:hypothetical protein